jgi:hypothetical protein
MPAKHSLYRRWIVAAQARKLLVFSLLSASALAAEPSFYAQFAVDALGTGSRTDFYQSVVVPMRNLGYSPGTATTLGLTPDEIRLQMEHSEEIRQAAYQFVMATLEEEGFPQGSAPPRLALEYRAILEDSVVIVIGGARGPNGEPSDILAVVTASHDFGDGTAGERRLRAAPDFTEFPRSPRRHGFVDFSVRRNISGVGYKRDYSLLLSFRKWAIGGPGALVEAKTLHLLPDLSEQARRTGFSKATVKAQIIALLQQGLSTHCTFYGSCRLDPEEAVLIPTTEELARRFEQKDKEIEELSLGDDKVRETLVTAIRQYATNPPPQFYPLIDTIFAEIGGIDPVTGRDLSERQLALFRRLFHFRTRVYSGKDPDIDGMRVHVVSTDRDRFDSGEFLAGQTTYTLPNRSRRRFQHVANQNHLGSPLFIVPYSSIDLSYFPTLKCEQHLLEFWKMVQDK